VDLGAIFSQFNEMLGGINNVQPSNVQSDGVTQDVDSSQANMVSGPGVTQPQDQKDQQNQAVPSIPGRESVPAGW
jgi:hypothetical protein